MKPQNIPLHPERVYKKEWKNWKQYIAEAKRCLATNGYLLIAETTNATKGRLSKLKQVIQQQGFDIYNEERGDFTFIEAREL